MKEGEWPRSGGGSWCVPNAVFGPDQAIEPVAYSRDPPVEFVDGRADHASDYSVQVRSVTIGIAHGDGDAPDLNAVIPGAVRPAINQFDRRGRGEPERDGD